MEGNVELPSCTVISNATTDIVCLFLEWELSMETISMLTSCGINSVDILKMIHSHDIDQLFNNREIIGEKIKFRYHLQKWRETNNLDLLSCCGSDRTISNTLTDWLSSCSSSRSSISFSKNSQSIFNIEEILKNTVTGEEIINYYKKEKTLNESHQTTLVRLICDHFYASKIRMDPSTMIKVSQAIVEMFPTENVTTYYVPRTNKRNPSGIMYYRYFNIKYKRKQSAATTTLSCADMEIEKQIEETPEPNVQKDFEFNKRWLLNNKPSNIAEYWKKTSLLRMRERRDSVTTILSEWPRYKDANGFELIDIDFETLYPGKSNLLFEKINDLEKKMNKVFFPSCIKDKLNLKYFEKMTATNLNTDSKYFYFFNLLHTIILPPRIGRTSKPSISDAQEDKQL